MHWLVRPPGGPARLPALPDLAAASCRVHLQPWTNQSTPSDGNGGHTVSLASVPPQQFLCPYESHCFSLCMCCDFYGCDCRMQCPEGCACYHDATWSANIIQCSRRGHADIPPLIPMDATAVFLDGNQLVDLSGQIFLGRSRMKALYLNHSAVAVVSNSSFLGLMDLQLLDLSHNALSVLGGAQLFGDLVNLRELYLQANHLTTIGADTFRPLKSLSVLRLDGNRLAAFPAWELQASNQFLIGLYLAGNPWTCDCDFVDKLRMFIDGNMDKVIDARMVKCIINNNYEFGDYGGGGLVTAAAAGGAIGGRNCIESAAAKAAGYYHHGGQASGRGENSDGDSEALAIIIGCCVMFLAVVFTACAAYRLQNPLRLWIHAKYGIRLPSAKSTATMINNNNADKLFDAYISYSLKDEAAVRSLAAELGTCYRLCLHHRDLTGGGFSSSAAAIEDEEKTAMLVATAARSAARTVLVMSQAYLTAEWQEGGVRAALLGPPVPSEVSQSVVILLMEDLLDFDNSDNNSSGCGVSFEVKNFITTCQFVLRWRESRFWTKLRYILPDPLPLSASDVSRISAENIDRTADIGGGGGILMWDVGLKDLLQGTALPLPSAATATAQQQQHHEVALNQPQQPQRAESASSLRFKSRSRASVQAAGATTTVESNSEFIYLTPKPKKARCSQGSTAMAGSGGGSHYESHQRSTSEVYLQQQVKHCRYHYHNSRFMSLVLPTNCTVETT